MHCESKSSNTDTSQAARYFSSPETKTNKSFTSVKEGTLLEDSVIRLQRFLSCQIYCTQLNLQNPLIDTS